MNKKPANSVGVSNIKRPVAPPVYRPQPVPKVLQTKKINQPPAPVPANHKGVTAPRAYRPQPVPRVLQTKSARPQSLPVKPALPNRTPVAPAKSTSVVQRTPDKRVPSRSVQPARPMGRPSVIQRVTYKGVLYDPASADAQANFLTEARRDLEAEGKWVDWRSETVIKQIGKSHNIILNVAELSAKQSSWKDYDKVMKRDLDLLGDVHRIMGAQGPVLEGLIPRLRAEDVSAPVNAAFGLINAAVGRIPMKKWKVTDYKTDDLEKLLAKIIRIAPWSMEERIQQAKAELAVLQQPAAAQAAGPLPPGAPAAAPGQSPKKLAKKIKEMEVELGSVGDLITRAVAIVRHFPAVAEQNERDLRESAVAQYKRGLTGHVSVGSAMKQKKFYLGEVATTSLMTRGAQGPTKGRGVLWASPWSPGVNTAFLEAGVESGAVYKLRTAIPANLRQMLVDGNQRDFRETVEREGPRAAMGDKTYWPFWQGQDERLTIYSEELMYLLEKGYRLHEFKRKNGKPNQQMMVHPSQLAAVTAAYAGR